MVDRDLDNLFRTIAHDGEDTSTTTSSLDAPSLRLLRCSKCKTLEELPDYKGNPEQDIVLEDLILRHTRAHPEENTLVLMRVAESDWKDRKRRRQIHKQIWSNVTGFTPEYYDTKNTYVDDALKCHTKHHRSFPCIDYKVERMRLGNPTTEGWRKARPADKVYLCQFCPVQTMVQNKINMDTGIAK